MEELPKGHDGFAITGNVLIKLACFPKRNALVPIVQGRPMGCYTQEVKLDDHTTPLWPYNP